MKISYRFLALISFLFTANQAFAQPANDNCADAILLTNVSNYCSFSGQFTNVGATASGLAAASCWGAAGNDVWFKFVASGTDVSINISGSGASGGTMNTPRVALYSGDCSTMNQQSCNQANATDDLASTYNAPLTVGQTYYIRVSSSALNAGTFQLCINNYTPPIAANADCDGAGLVCSKDPIAVPFLGGGGANDSEPIGTCMDDGSGLALEGNSVWLYFTVSAPGTLEFDLIPFKSDDDLDFVLYKLPANSTNSCDPGRVAIRCNASSCMASNGGTGLNATSTDTDEDPNCDIGEDGYVSAVNALAGETYALLVNNFSNSYGFNIQWGGTAQFGGTNAHFTVSNDTICVGSTITFDGSTSTNYTGLSWNFGSGTPATATGPGPHSVTFSSEDTLQVILTASGTAGCADDYTYQTILAYNATPSLTSINANTPCEGSPLVLTAVGSPNWITYTWTNNTTGYSSNNAVSTIPGATLADTGIYHLTLGGSGCTPLDTNIRVTINASPEAADTAGTSTQLCAGQTITLASQNTTSGATYTWSGPGGYTSNNINNTINNASASNTGTYTLTLTVNGCSTSNTVNVSLLSTPTAPATQNQSVCAGSTPAAINLTPVSGITYSWYSDAALTNLVTTGDSYTPSNTSVTTFYVTASNGQCTGTPGTQNLSVVPKPGLVGSPIVTNEICANDSGKINNIVAAGGLSPYTYSWKDVSNTVVGTTANLNGLSSGLYSLTITDANNCKFDTSIVVNNSNNLDANFTATPITGDQPLPVSFTNNSLNAATYTWSFGNGTSSNVENPATVTYDSAGTYTVLLTINSANGACTDTVSKTIIVTGKSSIEVPNVFTPNNDNTNEVFSLKTEGIKELTGEIYNRWGLRINEFSGPKGSWDGTTKGGTEAQSGTYYYIVKATGIDGKSYDLKGSVTLIRDKN